MDMNQPDSPLELAEKIGEKKWMSVGEWLAEAPDVVGQIAALAQNHIGPELHQEMTRAVWDWLEEHTPDTYLLGYNMAGYEKNGVLDLDVMLEGANQEWHLHDGPRDRKSYPPISTVPNPFDPDTLAHCRAIIANAQAKWFAQSPHAPVLVARFQGQETDEESDYILPCEGAVWKWDATTGWLDLSFTDQAQATESDSYASDQFRDSAQAPVSAQEWEGPFAISFKLHEPSPALIAARTAQMICKNTSPAPDKSRQVRI